MTFVGAGVVNVSSDGHHESLENSKRHPRIIRLYTKKFESLPVGGPVTDVLLTRVTIRVSRSRHGYLGIVDQKWRDVVTLLVTVMLT